MAFYFSHVALPCTPCRFDAMMAQAGWERVSSSLAGQAVYFRGLTRAVPEDRRLDFYGDDSIQFETDDAFADVVARFAEISNACPGGQRLCSYFRKVLGGDGPSDAIKAGLRGY